MSEKDIAASSDSKTNKTPGVSASYRLVLRVETSEETASFGSVAAVIEACGANIGAVMQISSDRGCQVRDIHADCRNEAHQAEVTEAVKTTGAKLIGWSDAVYDMHAGGKVAVLSKMPLDCRDALSMAYTPGVGRVCMTIAHNRERAFDLTIKQNTVAVVSDGTAVLGLGDIGPEAAMPVMEGKAMLFKEFGGVNAFPICLATKDVEEIIQAVKWLAPTFGGINLEDISAPRCFEIEDRLKAELDIPVFHDDQHGTAVVALAALKNALRITGKKMEDLSVVIAGVGAAGIACAKIFMLAGVRRIIGVDRQGAIYEGRKEHMNSMKEWFARHTNEEKLQGGIGDVCKGADLFLGVSGPGLLKAEHIQKMAKDPIIFAMANPIPEIMPEEAKPYARIMATGRSDYPNQINNVLCFPGLFRGCMDVRAKEINDAMKLAAADAIASNVSDSELCEEFIVPSVFKPGMGMLVAKAVADAAILTGVAKKA